jgi:hypothetical protein
MGVEARYQAIPEDCELLKRARQDRETAEQMQFFNDYATGEWYSTGPDMLDHFLVQACEELARKHTGLTERYFYAGSRNFDAIVYLLSPVRRHEAPDPDESLIYKAVYGSEHLHPEANASQGRPIGFVPAHMVCTIADYLDAVTREQLHEHYEAPLMREQGVYKVFDHHDERKFQAIWEEFEGMRRVYRAAADHGEAMITVID